MGNFTVRRANPADLPAILLIYNDEVVNGLSNLDIHPKSEEQAEEWFARYNREGESHPLLVAEAPDGHIAGFACLSRFREKEAYRSTVELSVYVERGHRQHGVGSALLAEILEEARSEVSEMAVAAVEKLMSQSVSGVYDAFLDAAERSEAHEQS